MTNLSTTRSALIILLSLGIAACGGKAGVNEDDNSPEEETAEPEVDSGNKGPSEGVDGGIDDVDDDVDDVTKSVDDDDISEDVVNEPNAADETSSDDVSADDVSSDDEPGMEPSPDPIMVMPGAGDLAGYLPEGCTIDYVSSGSDYCEVNAYCGEQGATGSGNASGGSSGAPVPAGDTGYYMGPAGDIAYEPGYGKNYQNSNCWEDEPGQWSCSCYSPTSGSRNLTLDKAQASGTDACGVALKTCAEAEEQTETQPSVCEISYAQKGRDYCETQQTCSQSIDVSGVQVSTQSHQSANCQLWDEEKVRCWCYGENQSFSFDVDGVSDVGSGELCDQTLPLCANGELPEGIGAPECELSRQSASQGYCEHTSTCTQQVALGDFEVNVSGSIRTYCNEVDSGKYECECSAGTFRDTVSVDAESSWDLCEGVAVECEERVLASGVSIVGGDTGYEYY